MAHDEVFRASDNTIALKGTKMGSTVATVRFYIQKRHRGYHRYHVVEEEEEETTLMMITHCV